MELNEKVLSSERLFQGVILGLRRDTVQLPNGKTARLEVLSVRRAGAGD